MCYGASADRALGCQAGPRRRALGALCCQLVQQPPKYAEYDLDLTGVKTVVIIGQGNVAVDCARVLTATGKASG